MSTYGSPTLLTQGLGIAPYMQQTLAYLMGVNDSSSKITANGFLKLAIENAPELGLPSHEKLRLTDADGHYSNVQLYYLKRALAASVDTSLDCKTGDITDRSTFNLSAPRVASRTIQVTNSDLMQFAKEATDTVGKGLPPSINMMDIWKQILNNCNAIAQNINTQLATDAVFGVNQTTGSASAKTININKDATKFDLAQGIPALITDAQLNEFEGDLLIAGAGYMLSYENNRAKMQAMLNGQVPSEIGGYEYYKDFTAPTTWGGANNIGVFAKGAIGFIDLNTMVGFRELNLGTYQSFQLELPVSTVGGITTMAFDVRIRFNNCPTDYTDSAYGGVRTIGEGWSIKISKQYGLFQQPTTTFNSGDRLSGNNGALLYTLTNSAS